MRIDVHQHLWSEPLVEALSARDELPFIRRESGLSVLYLAGERPYVIDLAGERPERRAELVQQDGLDRALLCLSSPLGIEWLPGSEAEPLLSAYHEGALALGEPFGVWGALALRAPDPDDVDRALEQGCAGISLPAGALAGVAALAHVHPILERAQLLGAPLLIHPGPGPGAGGRLEEAGLELGEPLWWPALTRYVAGMQAAWLAFMACGRPLLPRLRVVFAMMAGLAPLQIERIHARGGPEGVERGSARLLRHVLLWPRQRGRLRGRARLPAAPLRVRPAGRGAPPGSSIGRPRLGPDRGGHATGAGRRAHGGGEVSAARSIHGGLEAVPRPRGRDLSALSWRPSSASSGRVRNCGSSGSITTPDGGSTRS